MTILPVLLTVLSACGDATEGIVSPRSSGEVDVTFDLVREGLDFVTED